MEGQLDWKLGACWRPRLSSWWELLNRPWCFCAECKYLQPDVRPWAVLGEGVAPRVQVLPLWVHIFFFSPSTLSMARKPAGMSRSCDQGLCGECPRQSPCSWLGALCSGSEVERVTQKNTLRCAWSPALRRRGLFSPVSHPSPALRTSHICGKPHLLPILHQVLPPFPPKYEPSSDCCSWPWCHHLAQRHC